MATVLELEMGNVQCHEADRKQQGRNLEPECRKTKRMTGSRTSEP